MGVFFKEYINGVGENFKALTTNYGKVGTWDHLYDFKNKKFLISATVIHSELLFKNLNIP